MFLPSMIDLLVSWPSAPLTESLVKKSLAHNLGLVNVITKIRGPLPDKLVQWSSYDSIDHELTHAHRSRVLSSSYIIRKALIRKHYLSRSIHNYATKRSHSILRTAVPKTFEIEITFADELDELWMDDLWELGESLEKNNNWWILKPGMSDRGMGIRLFNSKAMLQEIFEEFEEQNSDEDAERDDAPQTINANTSVVTSQLRHFVIQEYINTPLLLEVKNQGIPDIIGHKFHLRAYCVVSGALKVYLYDRILALFAPVAYRSPSLAEQFAVNLQPHLTNTCLQTDTGNEVVRLLDELAGCRTVPMEGQPVIFTADDIANIRQQMKHTLCDTFKAALENPIHFQPLPNAFELYGVDFLIQSSPSKRPPYEVKLLEMNAEPAIEQTGSRLKWILEDLFDSIGKVCVKPFIDRSETLVHEGWNIGDERYRFIKCLDEEPRM